MIDNILGLSLGVSSNSNQAALIDESKGLKHKTGNKVFSKSHLDKEEFAEVAHESFEEDEDTEILDAAVSFTPYIICGYTIRFIGPFIYFLIIGLNKEIKIFFSVFIIQGIWTRDSILYYIVCSIVYYRRFLSCIDLEL